MAAGKKSPWWTSASSVEWEEEVRSRGEAKRSRSQDTHLSWLNHMPYADFPSQLPLAAIFLDKAAACLTRLGEAFTITVFAAAFCIS